MIGTFVLVFGILAIGANKFADGLNPFIVGFLIRSIGLSLGGTTGYAINPARDLGRVSRTSSFRLQEKAVQTGSMHGFQ